MNEFTGPELVPAGLRGYRRFRVDSTGQLRATGREYVYHKGVNHCGCLIFRVLAIEGGCQFCTDYLLRSDLKIESPRFEMRLAFHSSECPNNRSYDVDFSVDSSVNAFRMSDLYSYRITEAKKYHGGVKPVKDCSCGFYGFYHLDSLEKSTYVATSYTPGVIEASGSVFMGPLGFRAQKAEIKAVTVARDLHSAIQCNYPEVKIYHHEDEMFSDFPPDDVSGLIGG